MNHVKCQGLTPTTAIFPAPCSTPPVCRQSRSVTATKAGSVVYAWTVYCGSCLKAMKKAVSFVRFIDFSSSSGV